MDKTELFNKLTEKALSYLEKAETFTETNLPSYIQEILTYQTIEETLHLVIPIVLLFISLLTFLLLMRKDTKEERLINNDGDTVVSLLLIMILTLLVGLIGLIIQGLGVIQIYIAPKMYLIEYFKGL